MNRTEWFAPKFLWLKLLTLLGIAGLIMFLVGLRFSESTVGNILTFVGFLAIAPLVFWFSYIPILHWRDRYRGTHPHLWGGFMVFETTGWTRLIYWFAHVLADYRGNGIYRDGAE